MEETNQLLKLMEITGYNMIQENGQRKYGPPPDWIGDAPPKGCEVFVGRIPRNCFENELVPVFEKVGKIYEIRLMMDFSGMNRGYCFIMYTNKEDAKKAISTLNNYEIRSGHFLGVCPSIDNCRLFVGGIPKDKKKEEILAAMQELTEGVTNVIVYSDAADKNLNRGYIFVEYASHRDAAMARRKLVPGKINIFDCPIAVDWADPEKEIHENIKTLFIRNLMMGTTEETLRNIFNIAAGKRDAVDRIKKIKDFAFVHFNTRTDAQNALTAVYDKVIPCVNAFFQNKSRNGNESVVEVMWARPVDQDKVARCVKNNNNNLTFNNNINNYNNIPSSNYGSVSSIGFNNNHNKITVNNINEKINELKFADKMNNKYNNDLISMKNQNLLLNCINNNNINNLANLIDYSFYKINNNNNNNFNGMPNNGININPNNISNNIASNGLNNNNVGQNPLAFGSSYGKFNNNNLCNLFEANCNLFNNTPNNMNANNNMSNNIGPNNMLSVPSIGKINNMNNNNTFKNVQNNNMMDKRTCNKMDNLFSYGKQVLNAFNQGNLSGMSKNEEGLFGGRQSNNNFVSSNNNLPFANSPSFQLPYPPSTMPRFPQVIPSPMAILFPPTSSFQPFGQL